MKRYPLPSALADGHASIKKALISQGFTFLAYFRRFGGEFFDSTVSLCSFSTITVSSTMSAFGSMPYNSFFPSSVISRYGKSLSKSSLQISTEMLSRLKSSSPCEDVTIFPGRTLITLKYLVHMAIKRWWLQSEEHFHRKRGCLRFYK